MELNLSPELHARLKQVAEQQGRDAESLINEAVERLLRYEEWFVDQVEKGLAQGKRGEVLDHEEVGNRLEKLLTQKQTI
jgi:predicted transcriptional regulator